MRWLLPLLLLMTPARADDFVSSRAAFGAIMDYESGDLLWAKRADEAMPPASMSKLMVVAVVLDLIERGTISPDTPFDVSEKAWRTGGSKMFVLVDTQITVENLLRGIVATSGNDACVVVAENVAGSTEGFVALMNAKAEEWGLAESRFANVTGLPDPQQRMSARDLAALAKRLWERHPDHRYLFSIREFTWSDIRQGNRNPLLSTFEGALGMKTGHTDESGYSLVGLAERDGRTRILVLQGLESEAARRREADRMMRVAFDEYHTHSFAAAGDVIAEAPVFAGRAATVPLTLGTDLRFTLHERSLDGAEASIEYPSPLPAPIKAGEQVGVLRLAMPGEPEREYPLYAKDGVKALGARAKIGLGLKRLLTPPDAEVFE